MKSISIYRLNAILLLVILTTIILYYGKVFLIPLFFSIMLAMLLLPICRKLEKWGISRVWSTLIGILIILFIILVFLGIIGAQAASMSQDLPKMQAKAQQFIQTTQSWIESQFGVAPKQQINYLQKGVSKISQVANSFLTSLLSGAMSLITGLVLVILYFFFLMWRREKYKEFILKLVKDENKTEVNKELNQITQVAGQYLIGRLVSMAFLAVVYSIGFSILGLENGILVALVAVIPTIIPYIGAFIGGFFPLAIALISGTLGTVVPVIIILGVAQAIDNNIIEPLVEGESLDISPIFTIVAIVLGELVWGVAGMVLFIPLFAIIKIVFEHIPALHPFGFLLDNEVAEPKWMEKLKNRAEKLKDKIT
ncbi:AI-2E family transporter [Adhaeribacter aquaticus]|uniref:AI-2E family transporter n=1 Tax=Adhaeribacter aquaticus TaxID=299567 RepID=UPI00047B4DE0|nr:AI-2E family transporter [Adhaeribacter aquaticus]